MSGRIMLSWSFCCPTYSTLEREGGSEGEHQVPGQAKSSVTDDISIATSVLRTPPEYRISVSVTPSSKGYTLGILLSPCH